MLGRSLLGRIDLMLLSVCAGRVPTVRLMPRSDELRSQVGHRLELRCRSRRGRPKPRHVWSRNGVVLADRVNRVRITSSRLVIYTVKHNS